MDPPISRIVKTTLSGEIIDSVELKHILYHGGIRISFLIQKSLKGPGYS